MLGDDVLALYRRDVQARELGVGTGHGHPVVAMDGQAEDGPLDPIRCPMVALPSAGLPTRNCSRSCPYPVQQMDSGDPDLPAPLPASLFAGLLPALPHGPGPIQIPRDDSLRGIVRRSPLNDFLPLAAQDGEIVHV